MFSHKKELTRFYSNLIEEEIILDFANDCKKAWNTQFLIFKNLKTQILLPAIDLAGVSLGSGSACSSGVFEENHLLNFLGLKDFNKNTIRISVSPLSDLSQLEKTLEEIKKVILRLS